MIVKLRLENGSIHTVSPDLKNYRKVDFKIYDINLDLWATLLAKFTDRYKDIEEMTMSELLSRMKKPGISASTIREMVMEVHTRFATPFVCIFFGLLALPLGIKSHRAVKSKGFAVGLIIVATYYLLRLSGAALVENGHLSPVIGAWMPNIIFALLGIYIFYMSNKELSAARMAYLHLHKKDKELREEK